MSDITFLYTPTEFIIDNFYYNNEFNILICSKCQFCINNNELNTHLNTKHKELNKNIKLNIINKCGNYLTPPFNKIKKPEDYKYNFKDLFIYKNAFKCNLCINNFFSINFRALKTHFNIIHNIINNNKKPININNYISNLSLQTFFSINYKRRYFIIKENNNNINNTPIINTNIIEYNNKYKELKKANQLLIPNINSKENNGLIKALGLLPYLINKDINKYIELIIKPNKDEEFLGIIWKITNNLLYKLLLIIPNFDRNILNNISKLYLFYYLIIK
jgi:hypothetical protein